ncbi:hypothetical protein CCMSSC00406_0000620 [Pleurotus cornucopiae]|nr:hypothetical protein CCMSSC00406_0000620 [Pleurotus cornucopiae]
MNHGILAFNKRLQFKELLPGNSGRLASNRYLRLMGLDCTDIVLAVLLGLYAVSLNARIGISPWLGWADTHDDFSRVDQIPGVLWRVGKTFVTAVELSRWSIVVCAFIFSSSALPTRPASTTTTTTLLSIPFPSVSDTPLAEQCPPPALSTRSGHALVWALLALALPVPSSYTPI